MAARLNSPERTDAQPVRLADPSRPRRDLGEFLVKFRAGLSGDDLGALIVTEKTYLHEVSAVLLRCFGPAFSNDVVKLVLGDEGTAWDQAWTNPF